MVTIALYMDVLLSQSWHIYSLAVYMANMY